MKNVLTLLVFLGMSLVGANAQDGVKFREGSFQEALEVAREQKKMLFVDVYTSWCGPCRWMSEEVLQTSEAAAFFDKHFVCFKIDAEKGEGVAFAEKYDVRAYPTFLMFQPDGTLQHKVVGADTLHLFIPRVECGLHKKTSWSYLAERYRQGKLTKKEMPQALRVFKDAHLDEEVRVLVDSLFTLLTDKERLDSQYWNMYALLEYSDLFSDRFRFFVTHRAAIAQQKYDTESVNLIYTILMDHLLNNTTGRITREHNPWNCGEENEMPYLKELLELSDLPEKAFFEAWIKLAEACYNLDAEGVQREMFEVANFPESKKYQQSFLYAFEHFCPDAKKELEYLKNQWK